MTERGRMRWRHSEPLQRFLDGYLHQDFLLEYEDANAAARAFAKEADAAELRWVAAALKRFAIYARGGDEDAWREALRRQGGAWWPRSVDDIEALGEIVE